MFERMLLAMKPFPRLVVVVISYVPIATLWILAYLKWGNISNFAVAVAIGIDPDTELRPVILFLLSLPLIVTGMSVPAHSDFKNVALRLEALGYFIAVAAMVSWPILSFIARH